MRPQKLVTPAKGKLLGAKENTGFVDTFQYVCNVADTFKGDGLYIDVDRKDADTPVITVTPALLNAIQAGGGGGGDCSCDVSAYYDYSTGGDKLATWTNGTKTVDIYSSKNGGGGGTPYGAFQFEIKGEDQNKFVKFKYCVFQFGRKTYKVNGDGETQIVGTLAGTYCLFIPHSYPDGAMVVNGDLGNTLERTSIPIVELDADGNVLFDYRAMPVVPIWEATTTGA